MDPSVEKYLDGLRSQREEVERRLKEREYKKKESDDMFVSSVKKELEWLEKNKMKYELRNKKFLEEAKDIVEGYKAELAKAYQADQALNASRRKLNKFIQKNYPKIVSELKARLFRDHDDVSRKLKAVRDGGGEMLRLNKEIKDLSEEIQAKRYELLEEEERRLRNEGSLKYYSYAANPYTKPYDAPATYGKRTVDDLSRSKGNISTSPPKGAGGLGAGTGGLGRSTAHYDDVSAEDIKRPSTLSKTYNPSPDRERETLTAQKGVSFGRSNDVPIQRGSERQSHIDHGPGPMAQSMKMPPKEEHWGGSGGKSSALEFGKGGAPSGGGSAVSGSFGAKQDSPVKASGFGMGASGGGMQKLNLGGVGKQQETHTHGHSHAPPKQSVYNQQDLEDLEDFDDF